jgi:hypothetical protein
MSAPGKLIVNMVMNTPRKTRISMPRVFALARFADKRERE